MDYEANIRRLQVLADSTENSEPWKVEALEGAIAALRFRQAAEPKDEKAEWKHCAEVVDEMLATDTPDAVLMRDRAAARAEVEAKYAHLVEQEVGQAMDCAAHERAIRAVCAAEIAGIRAENSVLKQKLVEAEEEIERQYAWSDFIGQ